VNWIIAGIGGLVALMLMGETVGLYKVKQRLPAEWLARMITLEAGDIGPGEEWSAIMQVAINRFRSGQYGSRMSGVIATTRWPGGGARGRAWVEAVQADGGIGYRSAYGHRAPPDHPRWSEAKLWAARVWLGLEPNQIGARQHFYHPSGMPSCGVSQQNQRNAAGTLICKDGRWRPLWGVAVGSGGTARTTPIQIGRAVFS
jgi:hypothetical protein